jgi:RHS repeat-associated protein
MHQIRIKPSCKRVKRRIGSVIATAKADQSLEVGYAFSPYGQTQKVGVENQLAGSENSSQYTGRENDNNGLYFYRARYYDPVLKRFISEDPIGLAGGINSHAYVKGDPVSHTDPTGEIGLGGDAQTCMRCVDYLDVGISAVGGAFGVSGLSIVKRVLRNKKYGSVMGKTGRGVDENDINDLWKQFAKEKAAGWAAKKTTSPVNFECEDECKKFKLMYVVSNLL